MISPIVPISGFVRHCDDDYDDGHSCGDLLLGLALPVVMMLKPSSFWPLVGAYLSHFLQVWPKKQMLLCAKNEGKKLG